MEIRKTGKKKKMMKKEGEQQAARERRIKGESAPAAATATTQDAHSRSLSTANERPLPRKSTMGLDTPVQLFCPS